MSTPTLTPELLAQLKEMGVEIPAGVAEVELSLAPDADIETVETVPVSPTQNSKLNTHNSPAPSAVDRVRQMAKRSASAGLLGSIALEQATSKDYRLLPLETGIEAQITEREFANSKAGNEQMVLKLKVTFPLEFAGVDLTDYVLLDANDPKKSWKFRSLCAACTAEIDGIEQPLLFEDTIAGTQRYVGDPQGEDFLGNIVRFEAEHNEYPEGSGKIYNKIKGQYQVACDTPGLKS